MDHNSIGHAFGLACALYIGINAVIEMKLAGKEKMLVLSMFYFVLSPAMLTYAAYQIGLP